MARKCGVNFYDISAYETGKQTPKEHVAGKMAYALRLSNAEFNAAIGKQILPERDLAMELKSELNSRAHVTGEHQAPELDMTQLVATPTPPAARPELEPPAARPELEPLVPTSLAAFIDEYNSMRAQLKSSRAVLIALRDLIDAEIKRD